MIEQILRAFQRVSAGEMFELLIHQHAIFNSDRSVNLSKACHQAATPQNGGELSCDRTISTIAHLPLSSLREVGKDPLKAQMRIMLTLLCFSLKTAQCLRIALKKGCSQSNSR
jgi:hypothetical protein